MDGIENERLAAEEKHVKRLLETERLQKDGERIARRSAREIRDEFQKKHPHYTPPPER